MATPDPFGPILAVLRPSPARRLFGVGILGALGFVVITMAMRHPADAFGWTLFLLAFGLLTLWMAWRLWQATAQGLILTATGLHTEAGETIALLGDMAGIDRGILAVKPAGGFSVVLRSSGARAWYPGLWWRIGRRVGVGGVVSRHDCQFMATKIAGLIAARRPD